MPGTITVTEDELADLLERAADAHHVYEETRGSEDDHWALWYAAWIFQELEG